MYLTETNPEFVEAIKRVENNVDRAKRTGEYKDGRWFPGKSPEGGLPTLAYGHKITQTEWSSKRIVVGDTSKDFRYGLQDNEVEIVLKRDLNHAEDLAQSDWNKYIYPDPSTNEPRESLKWENLKAGYRMVLVDKVFNTGPLVKKGAWVWKSLTAAVVAGRDEDVVKASPAKYHTPDGELRVLTNRAIEICKAAKLPWQILVT